MRDAKSVGDGEDDPLFFQPRICNNFVEEAISIFFPQ